MAKKISYHYGDEQYNSSGNYSQGQASTEGSRYINSFIKEAENFFTAAEGELKRSKGFDAAAFFEKRKNRAVEMKDRAAIAAQYLDNDAYLYSQEDYDSLRDYLKNFGTNVDEVMGYYQPAVTAKQGMRAYEDEILAYQENQKKNQLPQWMQNFNMPEISNPAYGVLNWLNQPKDNTRFRAINDQWTDEQRYNLGLMQMEDPQKAQKYAAQVNRGEDPFQIAAQAQATQTARENMDLEAERREIDRLKAELDAYYWNTDFDAASQQSRTAFDAEIKRREQEIANRERELTLAQRVQDGIAYKGMTGNADFAEKSAYTSTSFGAPNLYGDYRLDYKDPTYEYINNTDGVREQASMTQKALANKGYDLMTEEEVGIYNYVYATEGKEAAEEYLNNIQDTLSTRKATQIFEGLEGRTGREILYGIGAGVNQFGTGVENLVNFNDEYIPANPYVVAGQMVREDLEDTGFRLPQAMGGASLGQMAYDVVSTSANMAPAVSAGALLGPGVGTALMGASAAGNAYQEALNDGYSKEQARMYSTLVGVSEATMEKLLGGFTNLGGDITKGVVGKIVGGVENAVAKAALELGGSMVSEGFEEGLQEVITPWIKNLTLMADEDVNWDEVAYSTLLGALSTLPMEGPRSAVNAFRYSRQVTGSSSSGSAAPIATSGKARAVQISTNQEVDVGDFASIDKNGNATVKTGESTTADINDISFPNETAFRRYNTVLSLPGIDTNTANEALHYLNENGGAEDTDSIVGIRDSYARGYYGMAYNPHGTDSGLISGTLSKKMYQIGRKKASAEAQNTTLKATQTQATPSEGYKKVVLEGKIGKLEGKKEASVKMMDFIADNFSGTTVHVYESYKRGNKRYYRDNSGKEHVAPNGQYVNDEIWVDLNAGDKGEGLSLNTFGHEMYHHVEKWNKKGAQDLASFLLRELGQKTSVDAAIQTQITKARRAGYGEKYFTDQGYTRQAAENMVYDRAMSDLVADSLESMFTHGDPAAALVKLRSEDQGLFNQIKSFVDEWVTKLRKFLKEGSISEEGAIVANLESFEKIQQMFMEAMDVAGQNFNAAKEAIAESPEIAGAEMTNEEAFADSEVAVHFSIRPPYSDGSKAFDEFADSLNAEARKTFDLFYGFYQRSRITNTVSVSGKRVKKVNISSLYLLAQDWNDMLAKEPKWAAAAKELADFLPADVRKRMNMNEDGTLNPTTMEKEFKMPSSMAQRLVDALPYESIDAVYNLGGKKITLPDGKARQSVGGEAYRRAIIEETRKLYNEGRLKPVGIGTMSKDRWGSLGFLAANGKTGASGDFTTVCPQMMFNRGCWYCYRRAAMEKGVNNKLVANNVWYTGEILRIKDSDIQALNKNGGLRIQSFGDWMPHFSAMLADVLYDAEVRGLQVKIITKEPSMINYIAALRDQGIGKNLYFNLSADYTIERGPAKAAKGPESLDAVNPERPFMRDQDNNFWWKRAMTVEEAAKYREKYPWVNTRIVATDVDEFIRCLKDNRVDVVTGYHGNIRGIERIDSSTGERKIEVEALGDAGMPRFTFNPISGQWVTEYAGKTATHKNLAQAIADNGLQMEYYTKTCCITGRCATCEGKCGALARDFNVKNATNRDVQSVAYWQKQMEYAETPEFGDLTVDNNITNKDLVSFAPDDGMFSLRNAPQDNSVRGILSRINVDSRKTLAEREHLGRYQDRLNQLKDAEARLADAQARMAEKPEKKELLRLQQQERMAKSDISRHKKFLSGLEKTDLFKRMIAEQRLVEYREKQKAKWDAQAEEYRQVRKQLTGADSVISVMEDEFVNLAKAYEDKIIDLKTMEREFIRLAKEYDKTAQEAGQVKGLKEDTAIWQREFRRLMREYDTAGRKIERLEATIERQRQRAAEKVQSRRNTEMRNKIIRRVGELEKMLLRGSKTSYVPEALRKPVSAILEAIDLRKSDKETKVAQHLKDLRLAYIDIQNDSDPAIRSIFDEGLNDHLATLTKIVGDTKLGDMTSEQMEAVYDIVTAVLETVRNANEAFVAGKRQMVSEMSETAMREVRSIGGNKNQGKVESDIVKGLKAFMWNDMRPVDIFNAIGSGQLKELFNSIRKGEDIWATDIREAREFFRQQWQKFKGDSWDMDKTYSFKSASGMGFQLNTEQIMSIYALFRRDKGQAMAHLRQGGFVFDNTVVDKNGKTHSDATAYNLTDDTILQIIGTLTKDHRAFVESMQGYLSDTMGAKGNEVSMKMYGIKLFREKNYFPLRSADQYMERAKAQQSKDNPPKLKNAGFTKPVQEGANTAIVLTPFLNAWGSHVDEMSNYHAFVLPMEDFYRVYNYRTDVSSEESTTRSVQAAIQNAYGEAAVKAIDQLLKDINGGVRGDSTAGIINKMISRYKKGATMASMSVAVQQPSAILRAAGMIDARYFVGAKPTSSMVGRTWDEIKKYAPIATIKEIGSFDTNTGRTATQYLTGMEYNGFDEKFRAFFKDGAFRDDMLGRLPAFMDEVSWSVIWNSVKREQAAKNPGMDTKSEAFMQKVADRFTDVIVNTQVYDSVLAKNAMMRSKESGMKMVTAFMAEPTVTANMVAGAFLNFRRTGDKKALAKTLGSIVAATVVNLAAVSVVYALRDDDEDERFDEKWIASIRNNLFETVSPASYIPILRDMQSIAMGYDVERPDMSVVNGVYEALMSVFDDDIGSWDKVEKVVGAVGNAAGFPAKNLIRDAKGIWNTLRQAYGVKNVSTKTGRQIAWRGEKLDNGEQLLLAIQGGDMAHMERVAARFEDMDKAMGGLMTAIRRQYVEGIMEADEAKELLMTYNELSEDDVYWKLQEWDYAKANGTSDGYTKMGDLLAAVESGEGLEEQIQRYKDNGMDDSDIRSQISREYHEPYLEADEAGREQIRQTVGNALRATGSTESDIQDKFKGWDFETEYGMTYSDMIEGYREGEVNRIQMRDAMTFYGLKNFEINEKLADLDGEIAFMNQYGMSLSEMKALYGEGDITRNQMVNALVYSGKSKNEAQEMVTQMDIENRIGIEYAKLDDAYRAGDISRNTLYNAMLDNGATREEADEAIVGYDWLKRNAQGDRDLTITDAKKFAVSIGEKAEGETLTDYGVSIAAYKEYKAKVVDCKGVDANGDGKTDSGTLRDSILRMIDSLPISDTAKDGLALLRYSKSSIRKNAPWH